jgi:hypothetical protein
MIVRLIPVSDAATVSDNVTKIRRGEKIQLIILYRDVNATVFSIRIKSKISIIATMINREYL